MFLQLMASFTEFLVSQMSHRELRPHLQGVGCGEWQRNADPDRTPECRLHRRLQLPSMVSSSRALLEHILCAYLH